MDKSMREVAHTIATSIACLKEKFNVLIICGLHNKRLAEHIVLESYTVGAYPYLWVFDEKFLLTHAKFLSGNVLSVLPKHVHSLLVNSDVVIWLSQFGKFKKHPTNFEKAITSFWDDVYKAIRTKPNLYVNLLSAESIENIGIDYKQYLQIFIKAVNVDYLKIRKIGNFIASKLRGKRVVHVYDDKGTDLTFNIDDRNVGVEVGTLEDCFSSGRECEVEVPGGEVYVAPIETSANGVLAVQEFRDYNIKNLKLHFKGGKIEKIEAERGSDVFKKLLNEAEGDKDRIAELGIGINYGVKLTGYRMFDEKALGTAHIAVGNNTQLGGVNKASIHWDFILNKPNIEVDGNIILKKGKLVNH